MVRKVAIIPARYGSTRFPGKALALLGGQPLVVRVVQRVWQSQVFDDVWVATDDRRILDAVAQAGGEAFMTQSSHATGTERIGELAAVLPENAIVFNVQGDEPLVHPQCIKDLMQFMESDPQVQMATAAHRSDDPVALQSRHVVKVVLDSKGRALYFSRAAIPHDAAPETSFLRHVGMYAFRRSTLTRFLALPPGSLEILEGLEQLRALENGIPIHVMLTRFESIGVDTPADLKVIAARFESERGSSLSNSSAPRLSGKGVNDD